MNSFQAPFQPNGKGLCPSADSLLWIHGWHLPDLATELSLQTISASFGTVVTALSLMGYIQMSLAADWSLPTCVTLVERHAKTQKISLKASKHRSLPPPLTLCSTSLKVLGGCLSPYQQSNTLLPSLHRPSHDSHHLGSWLKLPHWVKLMSCLRNETDAMLPL